MLAIAFMLANIMQQLSLLSRLSELCVVDDFGIVKQSSF
jgi:hypothetical protein